MKRLPLQSETARIVALPAVKSAGAEAQEAVRRAVIPPGSPFRFEGALQGRCQLAALAALWQFGGLLGLIGVGFGKTLIAILAPVVLGSQRPVYLCPPGLVDQWHAELAKWARVVRVPAAVQVLPYSILQHPHHARALEELDPDLVIGDEAHTLRNVNAATTSRVLECLEERQNCAAVFLSGTLTTNSLADYAHLGAYVLGDRSPLPRGGPELAAWCAVIDPQGDPQRGDFRTVGPLIRAWGRPPVDDTFGAARSAARTAYRRRLTLCPGVITTSQTAIGCSLELVRIFGPSVPQPLVELAREVMETQRLPGSAERFDSIEDAQRCALQLAFGFWYEWDWPSSISSAERGSWRTARSDWAKFLRHELEDRRRAGYDSPHLITRAVAAELEAGGDDWHHRAFARWEEQRLHLAPRFIAAGGDRDKPPTRTHWVDRFLPRFAAQFAQSAPAPMALWYRFRALGEALAAEGLPVYGPGTPPPLDRAETCGVSIRAWGQGRRLEAWDRFLVLDWPASGKVAEQLIGRHHRPGQVADCVRGWIWQGSPVTQRRWRAALEDAVYIEETTRQRQKLGYATIITADTAEHAHGGGPPRPRARFSLSGARGVNHGAQK